MSELGRAIVHDEDDLRVVSLAGEVDAANVDPIREQALLDLPNSALGMIVDLTRLTYIDSAGLAFLFESADALTRRGQALGLVVAAQSPIRRALEVTQVDEVASIDRTLEAARTRMLGRGDERTG